jgi:predicted dithiol-disulfide oxidoreductase (DUF899 family)
LLRLLSAGNSTFKYDLGSEDREGHQDSTVSVFTRDADGTLRHFYTALPRMAPDIQQRGIDLLAPIWHFMDLTRQGRGNRYTSLDYGTKVRAAWLIWNSRQSENFGRLVGNPYRTGLWKGWP